MIDSRNTKIYLDGKPIPFCASAKITFTFDKVQPIGCLYVIEIDEAGVAVVDLEGKVKEKEIPVTILGINHYKPLGYSKKGLDTEYLTEVVCESREE